MPVCKDFCKSPKRTPASQRTKNSPRSFLRRPSTWFIRSKLRTSPPFGTAAAVMPVRAPEIVTLQPFFAASRNATATSSAFCGKAMQSASPSLRDSSLKYFRHDDNASPTTICGVPPTGVQLAFTQLLFIFLLFRKVFSVVAICYFQNRRAAGTHTDCYYIHHIHLQTTPSASRATAVRLSVKNPYNPCYLW